jgi:hypothetical protein
MYKNKNRRMCNCKKMSDEEKVDLADVDSCVSNFFHPPKFLLTVANLKKADIVQCVSAPTAGEDHQLAAVRLENVPGINLINLPVLNQADLKHTVNEAYVVATDEKDFNAYKVVLLGVTIRDKPASLAEQTICVCNNVACELVISAIEKGYLDMLKGATHLQRNVSMKLPGFPEFQVDVCGYSEDGVPFLLLISGRHVRQGVNLDAVTTLSHYTQRSGVRCAVVYIVEGGVECVEVGGGDVFRSALRVAGLAIMTLVVRWRGGDAYVAGVNIPVLDV